MASNKIKVSIIIPVYNVEKYLEKCVKSVLNQTLKEIEIFLIDDGSSDKSWNIVKRLARGDKRIVALQQENSGAAVARNRGLELAKGEYIGFVDSDDYVDADYFEQLYKAAVSNEADIARAYVKAEIETGDHYQMTHSVDGYNSYYNIKLKKEVLANKLSLTSSNWLAIYKRSMLTKHNIAFIPEIRTGQDNIFNLHVSYVANKVVFVDEPTYYHMVRRDGSLMTGYNFTAQGLISRALVIEETVNFLNAAKNYNKAVYVARVKDVFDFFHSRLIKTSGLTRQVRQKLIGILVTEWAAVKYKSEITRLLRHDARFIEALKSERTLNAYLQYRVPTRRILSRVEKKRQALRTGIRQNRPAYKVLRPPVMVLRKFNKLLNKILY
jgi:glycosyltransferase involved in cell wall biosynthesis